MFWELAGCWKKEKTKKELAVKKYLGIQKAFQKEKWDEHPQAQENTFVNSNGFLISKSGSKSGPDFGAKIKKIGEKLRFSMVFPRLF